MPGDRPARVAVTGVGTVSALGAGGRDVLGAALERAETGLRPVAAFASEARGTRLVGEVGDLAPYLAAGEARRIARASQLTVVACRLALADAGLEPGGVSGLGVVLGSQYGDFRSSADFALGYLARGPLGLSPVLFPNTVMNAMAANAAIAVGARGPMLTVNQAGVAGELAIGRAALLIAAGRARAVLAGGVDELCPLFYRELCRLGGISPLDGGAEGCWPFDRRANGTVPGEGATVVLLEAESVARARGVPVHAVVAGAAWGNLPAGPHGFPRPRRREPAVVRRALAAAAVRPRDLTAVYLAGSGHPDQDACELDLIARALPLGAAGPRLTALTPLAGEHAGLGGLRVAAAAIATIGRGRLPGLPDLAEPVRPDLPFARGPAGPVARGPVLVHALGRGGGHAALVLTAA